MGKYLENLNPEIKEYFKVLSPEFPEWLEKYIETKEYFFLLISKNQAHCINKSGFSNNEELDIARKLIEKIKLDKKGKKS